MANETARSICSFENIEQTVKCYAEMFGCTLRSEQSGTCTTLDCRDGELYVCPRTTTDEGMGGACEGFVSEEARWSW